MLCREIIAVCSQIHTKHINTLCGQNIRIFNVKYGGTYCDHYIVKGLCHWGSALHPLIFWIQHVVSDRTGWGVSHLYNFKMHLHCIRNIAWGQRHRCTGLTTLALLCSVLSWNLGVWTCRIPQGLSRPLQGLLHPYIYIPCIGMCILKSSRLCDFAACCASDHFISILLCFHSVIPWKEVVLMAVVGRVSAVI